ncbi:hypothetical protein BKP64_08715 [Marinobacter salinus]|uniref:Uncharacterized protein n=1 Tax=Marinobacter salinus TaxID=1874317 RepID=A0A1D9GKS5_9GAMM|nr:hypothetical protein [Marinobacter salinus]AOY88238.1 hypothetical protein BKP64_08715 [Marinobacter salinus]
MAVSFDKGFQLARGLILASALLAGQASALAPEHETRRLMLATEEAVAAENWAEAGEYLNRLQQLEGNKPADYFYYRGRVMYQAAHLNEAQSALESYVEQGGADGSHYQEALKLITGIEKARKERALAPQGGNSDSGKIALIEPAGDQKIASLRKLYLADSDREALTIHLNSLLEVAGWRQDQTIVQMDRPADVEYRVSAADSTINVQEIRRDTGGRVVRKTQSMSVYGVNPQVEWGCEAAAAACWIYDPRDGSRLLQLAVDREQAREVARTLGQLIRNLQAPADS